MVARPGPARALLPFLLAVGAALPAGTTAQTSPPPAETSWLSASVSEARRSPFHSPASVPGPALLGPVLVPAPVSEGSQLAGSASDPSFLRVFLPTLLVTAAADFAGLGGVVCLAYGCRGWESLLPIFGPPALFLAPPTAAKLAGGSFGSALLGSALGVGAGWVILTNAEDDPARIGQSGWPPATLIVVPFLHAGLTTLLSLKGH